MTFRACDLFVLSREHELRALVRKFCRGLPAGVIVATRAIFTQLPAMLIAMTTHTILRKPEKGFRCAHGCIVGKSLLDMLRLMASATFCLLVLAFHRVSGLTMIEIRFAFFPMNQRKLHTVMIAMARGAKLRFVSCAFGRG